jgi:hypothetical protein
MYTFTSDTGGERPVRGGRSGLAKGRGRHGIHVGFVYGDFEHSVLDTGNAVLLPLCWALQPAAPPCIVQVALQLFTPGLNVRICYQKHHSRLLSPFLVSLFHARGRLLNNRPKVVPLTELPEQFDSPKPGRRLMANWPIFPVTTLSMDFDVTTSDALDSEMVTCTGKGLS